MIKLQWNLDDRGPVEQGYIIQEQICTNLMVIDFSKPHKQIHPKQVTS